MPPPRSWRRLLRASCCTQDRDFLMADLEDEFEQVRQSRGEAAARRWYRSQALRSLWPCLKRRIQIGRRQRQASRRGRPLSGGIMLSSFLADIRLALRNIGRYPGFSSAILLTLALGIAANASVFSVVNSVLLRPLPYRIPEQLVFVWDGLDWIGVPRAWVMPAELDDLRNGTSLFEGFAALRTGGVRLTGDGEQPRRVTAGVTSDNLFTLLGVQAHIGRTFVPGEDLPGAEPLVVLQHHLWQSRYGGGEVLGRRLEIDGEPYTVIGVLPPDFRFLVHSSLGSPAGADLWVTHQTDLSQVPRGNHNMAVLGRIKDGVSLPQARKDLEALGRQADETYFGGQGFTYKAVPLHGDLVSGVRESLWMLLAAVGFVLLIATANIATLLLAKAQRKQREFAVRQALGAGRWRLFSQVLAEGLTLGVVGSLAGLLLSLAGVPLLKWMAPAGLPLRQSISVDASVWLFGLALGLVTGLLCGLSALPQWRPAQLGEALSQGGRGSSWAPSRLRSLLVTAEVALAVMLLAGASLLLRSFQALSSADGGFRAGGILTFSLERPQPEPDFLRRLQDRLAGLPQVKATGAADSLPLRGSTNQTSVAPTDRPQERVLIDIMRATPGYFRTMGIELLRGRGFTWQDDAESATVVVIDESLAQLFWPGQDPLGQTLGDESPARVVGVVRHARLYSLERDDRPQVYLPLAQRPTEGMNVVLLASGDPARLTGPIRALIDEMDPSQPIYNLSTMQGVMDRSLAENRFAASLISAFALAALALASLGIYGVLSFLVGQRTREIGLRMALGSQRKGVLTLILRQGISMTLLGLVVGAAGSLLLGRLLSSHLYEVSPADPWSIGAGTLLLLLVAALACLLPALRAASLDPVRALRCE
ncbi:MAG TPA: ADOP family duplicated permease [Acidobacteriota bacterium]|nr:ADOP family duplicated permease [Acidobacteriota bacterium]